MNLAVLQSRLWRCVNIPIGLPLMILSPTAQDQRKRRPMGSGTQGGEATRYARASHMHVIHLGTVLAPLEDEDLHIWVFRQTPGDNGTTCSTTAYLFQLSFRWLPVCNFATYPQMT